METDLIIPIFWTVVFGSLTFAAVRRWTRKLPTNKKWTRPEDNNKDLVEK
tara:strand:+ start:1122 stop:1271 length:150 start_codon:yes stop_codon:yes gene_type:complete